MLPVLSIGSVAIPTYPLFLLVALWAGLWVAALQAKRLNLDGDHVYNAGLYGLVAGVIGARLWFVLSHWNNYAGDLTQALSLSRNALAPGAGLMIAGLVGLIYLQRQQVPVGTFLDALALGLALAVVIGHIGAFLGGQELGAFSLLPWAIETAGTPRHPFHLYAAGAGLLSLLILFFSRRWRPWSGFHFWLFVALYSLGYLLLEIFRAQPPVVSGGYLVGQLTALAALVVTLGIMAYNFTGNVEKESRFVSL
jgi:phosphatidylglycerol:prolipoprotein diacylglycerol transferase